MGDCVLELLASDSVHPGRNSLAGIQSVSHLDFAMETMLSGTCRKVLTPNPNVHHHKV